MHDRAAPAGAVLAGSGHQVTLHGTVPQAGRVASEHRRRLHSTCTFGHLGRGAQRSGYLSMCDLYHGAEGSIAGCHDGT